MVRDANSNPLQDGDAVILVKDLKVKGSSSTLKKGSKIKGIRLVDGADGHNVDCKTDLGSYAAQVRISEEGVMLLFLIACQRWSSKALAAAIESLTCLDPACPAKLLQACAGTIAADAPLRVSDPVRCEVLA